MTGTYHPVTGGGETQTRSLAEGLLALGHQAIVVTRRSNSAFASRETVGTVDIFRLAPSGAGQSKKWGFFFSVGLALLRLRRQYDLILVSGFQVPGVPAVISGRLLGKRVILKADSLGEMSGDYFRAGLARWRLKTTSFPFRLFLWIRNAVLRKANAFVAISEEIAKELLAEGIPEKKIWRIPNSVDTGRFQPVCEICRVALREKLGIASDACVVAYVGRLVSYKGLPLLLCVWKEIAKRFENAHLLLVGSGGLDIHDCEAELKHFVRSEQLKHHVIFTGAVYNVEEYLQAADVFVFPTEIEAFGIALVEAMSCAMPVVTTAVGGLKDIARAGENALVVQPGNFEELLHALETLIRNKDYAHALGRAARQSVLSRYASDVVNRKYLDLFKSIATE